MYSYNGPENVVFDDKAESSMDHMCETVGGYNNLLRLINAYQEKMEMDSSSRFLNRTIDRNYFAVVKKVQSHLYDSGQKGTQSYAIMEVTVEAYNLIKGCGGTISTSGITFPEKAKTPPSIE